MRIFINFLDKETFPVGIEPNLSSSVQKVHLSTNTDPETNSADRKALETEGLQAPALFVVPKMAQCYLKVHHIFQP